MIEGTRYDGRPVLQFNYTHEAMRGHMTPTERACRGLIVDPSDGSILALVMPKFYNVGEPDCPPLPDEPYEVFSKIDGSLCLYWHDGTSWRCNTRGSFDNDYTAVGLHYWEKSVAKLYANPNWTIMCEICVDNDEMPRAAYHPEGIYLLAIRDRRTGVDISILSEEAVGLWGQLQIPNLVHTDLDALLDAKKTTEGTEGWVIRYKSGLRVKIKTAWYLHIFRAIQALTPKNVREMMMEGHDWVADLPDDVRPKAVEMEELIAGELAGQLLDIYEAYSKVAHIKERKEYARVVTVQYPAIASYLFSLRDGKFREEDVLRKLDLRFLQEAI